MKKVILGFCKRRIEQPIEHDKNSLKPLKRGTAPQFRIVAAFGSDSKIKKLIFYLSWCFCFEKTLWVSKLVCACMHAIVTVP